MFPNTQAEFKVSLLAGHGLSSWETEWNVLCWGLLVSCSMGLRGNLWLFTQVLVEFWLQKARIRIVLHQTVYPLLCCCKAATGCLLDILGNQSFCLKVYVYLEKKRKQNLIYLVFNITNWCLIVKHKRCNMWSVRTVNFGETLMLGQLGWRATHGSIGLHFSWGIQFLCFTSVLKTSNLCWHE